MIGYYIHHHGAGHLTRAVEIAQHLGTDVTGLSSVDKPSGWRGDWVRLPHDAEPAPPQGADLAAGGVLHYAPVRHAGYSGRMEQIAAWCAVHKPSVMVVDVSVEVSLLARLLGIPVIVAGMRGDRRDRPHAAAYDAAAAIIAPWPADMPEPWPDAWLAKTHHVGGISRFDVCEKQYTEVAEHADVSAGPPRMAVLTGRGGGSIEALPNGADIDVIENADADDVRARLLAADVVVAHAGQNSVAEVASVGKPAIIVAFDRPFNEQEATAQALEDNKIAATSRGWPQPDQWAALIDTARKRGGARWRRWLQGGGALTAARAIRTVALGATDVVIIAKGRHEHLRAVLSGLARQTTLPRQVLVVAMGDDQIKDIVAQSACHNAAVMDIAATGEHLPLAQARNLGAEYCLAKGAQGLIFLDVDCIPADDLVERYCAALVRQPAGLACGPVTYLSEDHSALGRSNPDRLPDLTDPHDARPNPPAGELVPATRRELFWSLSFACMAEVWRTIGGFDEGYRGYGGEDTDFSVTAERAAIPMYWVGGAHAWHQWHPVSSPPVEHAASIVRNANRYFDKWGADCMQGWLDAFEARGIVRREPSGHWVYLRHDQPRDTREAKGHASQST